MTANGLTIPRVHIVGCKNSGKTTLIVELVQHLSEQGLRVGTMKHTHHKHELDTPGKDSHRHRAAGATAVGILSPDLNAVFRPAHGSPSAASSSDEERYRQLMPMFDDCDLIIVEGHSRTTARKLEIWRTATGTTPLCVDDTAIFAVISDDPLDVEIPVWSRQDLAGIAANILRSP